jgi:hypothetical protein
VTEGITTVAGLRIPSTDPVFLSVIALHIPLGVVGVVAGAVAILSAKRPGRHPTFGTVYFWSLGALLLSASILSFMRWAEDYHLFILGTLAFLSAYFGRRARRRQEPGWLPLHVAGMGSSYMFLLTAFYVDNGSQLPLWRDLPSWTYWATPVSAGATLILWALLRHPLVRYRERP